MFLRISKGGCYLRLLRLLGLYCPLSRLRMKRLWYELRLLTLGAEECLSFASILGVMALTLPALDNDPCDGTVSHPSCTW
jgi:hypothetical protein